MTLVLAGKCREGIMALYDTVLTSHLPIGRFKISWHSGNTLKTRFLDNSNLLVAFAGKMRIINHEIGTLESCLDELVESSSFDPQALIERTGPIQSLDASNQYIFGFRSGNDFRLVVHNNLGGSATTEADYCGIGIGMKYIDSSGILESTYRPGLDTEGLYDCLSAAFRMAYLESLKEQRVKLLQAPKLGGFGTSFLGYNGFKHVYSTLNK